MKKGVAFVDPEGYTKFIDQKEQEFRTELANKNSPPSEERGLGITSQWMVGPNLASAQSTRRFVPLAIG